MKIHSYRYFSIWLSLLEYRAVTPADGTLQRNRWKHIHGKWMIDIKGIRFGIKFSHIIDTKWRKKKRDKNRDKFMNNPIATMCFIWYIRMRCEQRATKTLPIPLSWRCMSSNDGKICYSFQSGHIFLNKNAMTFLFLCVTWCYEARYSSLIPFVWRIHIEYIWGDMHKKSEHLVTEGFETQMERERGRGKNETINRIDIQCVFGKMCYIRFGGIQLMGFTWVPQSVSSFFVMKNWCNH